MLAVNSGVEAARLGQAGAGFKVLSQRIEKLVTHIQSAVDKIQDSSEENHALLERSRKMQGQLRGDDSGR